MGYLDSAGLSHFTAWVKARLSGKQDALTPDGSITLQGGDIAVSLPTKTVTKAEYDALTEAEKQAEVLYAVTDDAGGSGGGGGSSEEVYSTEETQIGTWIDGRPLYRITCRVTSPSAQGDYVPTGVKIENLGEINKMYGTLNVGGGIIAPIPALETASSLVAIAYRSNGLCLRQVHPSNAFSGKPCVISIEYTKTTDEGSST